MPLGASIRSEFASGRALGVHLVATTVIAALLDRLIFPVKLTASREPPAGIEPATY